MIKYGASMLSWIAKWNTEAGVYAIEQTATAGFDCIEISLPATLDIEPAFLKKQLIKNNIAGKYSVLLPKEYHLPKHPEKALHFLKRAIDFVAEMNGDFLGGVFYASIGEFTGKPSSLDERKVVSQILDQLCKYAEAHAIVLALEPVNRYESYLITCTEDALEFIEDIKCENLGLMLDTFHMNIEEPDFFSPIVAAGSKLKYMHITESNRGMLGEGQVNWDDLFKGLATINYSGPLVLENFSSQVQGIAELTSLWRNSKYNATDLAIGSLNFMKMKAKKWGLDH